MEYKEENPGQEKILSKENREENLESDLKQRRLIALERLHKTPTIDTLWEALTLFSGFEFQTVNGLKFTYTIRGNEMFVDRKDKSITRATVNLAFLRAQELGGLATGPKKLGCFGASYLYPVFIYLHVIAVKS